MMTADLILFVQLRAEDVVGSRSKYGGRHVYPCPSFSRRFHRICGDWAPAFCCCHFLLIYLVPAFALASHDATYVMYLFSDLQCRGLITRDFVAMSFSSMADARNAIQRLRECFTAELMSETYRRDPELPYALEIENASFTWDSPPPEEGKGKKGKKKQSRNSKQEPVSAPASTEVKEEVLFNLKNINIKIPRGQLVAIVGAVGSGKTSLLQGLIGDMRKTEGSVRFGGSVAYSSQSAWIQVSCLP
jgi:ABC-type multidrug transport system fused ATPase/permease subunit